MSKLRRKLFFLLEGWGQASLAGRLTDAFLIGLILVNILALTIETIGDLHQKYFFFWLAFEAFSVGIFSLEYLLRIWVIVESPENTHIPPWKARLHFIMRPLMIVDLIAILPIYLLLFGIAGPADLRVLRIVRVLRILKLVRYSPAMQMMYSVLQAEKRAIMSALMIGVVVLFISSALIHSVEGHIQPDAFGSIPDAMWWAIATLTTVGYGDVVPQTAIGRILGGMVMLSGIGVFGLWAGIMASGFSDEVHRRGFRVKWQMIAQCPVFETLTGQDLSAIAREVRPITIEANYLVERKGNAATHVYFIVNGVVEAELPKGLAKLTTGDHFGELGILHGGKVSTTFVTLETTQLLVMGRRSFEELLEKHPNVRDRFYEIALERRHWFDDEVEEI